MPYTPKYKPRQYTDIKPIIKAFEELRATGPGARQIRILSGLPRVRWKVYDFLHHMELEGAITRAEWRVAITSQGLLTLSYSKIELKEQAEEAKEVNEKAYLATSPLVLSEEAYELAQKYLSAFGPTWSKWPRIKSDLDNDLRSEVFRALQTLIPSSYPEEMDPAQNP